MTFPSKSLLLTAILLSASRAPFSLGDEMVIDTTGPVLGEREDLHLLFTPDEFLRRNSPSVVLESTFPTPQLHSLFQNWKDDFSREYESDKENALRKLIWLENHDLIESHMEQISPSSHSLSHNDFSDMTNDEFQRRFYLGEYSPGVKTSKGMDDGSLFGTTSSASRKLRGDEEVGNYEAEYDSGTVSEVPESKDWREEGAVTKVKNQWLCGA